ncbi:DUF928 domain-containing protein [Leptolyngbya sp. CCY15150]|uniref:DUF928 domain-containing protein n=1 Tax=Leptolyngbya sp. CCY15150 TaxID=2767772 RepID=UPI00195233F1|nr:DUF928 domain-containing protein [Leptolyngbya sp. CCY15150]
MMSRTRLIFPILVLLGLMLAISPTMASPDFSSPPLYAQSDSQEGFWSDLWRRLTSRPSPTATSGSTSQGGANHDRCLYTTEELLAIVPVSTETGIPYLEPVLSGYPTWWFYVPYEGNGRLQAEFVLIDDDEIILYEHKTLVPSTSGLMPISWNEDQPPLTPGQRYRWVFSILCNPGNRSGDATVNGWIQRVTADEAAALRDDLNDTQPTYLALVDSLYWFDLLAEVNTLKTSDPQQFAPLWDSLLCQVYAQSDRLTNLSDNCPGLFTPSLPEPN